MPRTCTVCSHPDRAAIDAALLEGASLRDIAGRFGTSKSTAERHKREHLSAAIAKARGSADVARGDGLLANVKALSARAERMFREAERILRRALRERDHDTALEAIRTATTTMREARGTLELLVKVYVAAGEVLTRAEAMELLGRVLDALMVAVPEQDRRAAIGGELQRLVAQAFSREVLS
jgi:transposase